MYGNKNFKGCRDLDMMIILNTTNQHFLLR